MSIDAAPTSTALFGRPVTPAALRERVTALSPRICVAATVAVSFVVRAFYSLAHGTPRYFPDEYIYSSLARSIAESGKLQIRGVPAQFPALLEPLLASPSWLTHDPALAYRLTLGLHALVMSLAVVPAYLLARRLSISPWLALGCGVFAVSIPDMVYVNYVTADAVAYPLVLGAVAAGVAAVETSSTRAQLAFISLAGLSVFARVQYVILPAIFVIAVIAAERGHIDRALRRYKVTLVLFTVPILAAVAAGPGRLLGYYHTVFSLSIQPGALGHWAAVDSMLLVYAGGLVLVPAAVLGTLAAVVRPRGRAEGAFAWIAVGLAVGLLAEAALYAGNANGTERFQERYLFALLPLLPIGFLLSLSRKSLRIPVAALAAALLLVALRVPLTGYTTLSGKQDSPLLQAVFQLERQVSGYGTGGLVVASMAVLLFGLAAATAFRPRMCGTVALLAAIAVTSLSSAAALTYDIKASGKTAFTFLPSDYRFVDHAAVGPVSVVVAAGTPRPLVSEHLFWNTSIDRVFLLPHAGAPDIFGTHAVRIDRNGVIMRGRQPVRGPLLIEELANSFSLSGATLVRRDVSSSLWVPAGTPRVTLPATNRYLDGWLGSSSKVTVWPDRSGLTHGSLHLRLSLPTGEDALSLRVRAPDLRRTIVVRPGKPVD